MRIKNVEVILEQCRNCNRYFYKNAGKKGKNCFREQNTITCSKKCSMEYASNSRRINSYITSLKNY